MKTSRAFPLPFAFLALLAACSGSAPGKASADKPAETTGEKPAATPAGKPAETAVAKPETPEEQVKRMNADIDALNKKAEHKDAEVTVQHLLVGVTGDPRLQGVKRSPGEAETLAAQLYARIQAGEDFETLIKNYTNDAAPGIYSMSLGAPSGANVMQRKDMAQGFGDVAWRLQVGEYGIAPYDGGIPGQKPKSPFGYHIIKRLK